MNDLLDKNKIYNVFEFLYNEFEKLIIIDNLNFDDLPEKDKEKLNFEMNENISILEIDLSKIDFQTLPQDIDVVYYLAQSNRFREFPDGVDDMLSINVLAPNILAKWAVNNSVKKFI